MIKLILVFITLIGCGEDSAYEDYDPPAPAPSPKPGPPPAAGITWLDVLPIVEENCAACHSGDKFISSGKAMKDSASAARIANGSMPPPGSRQAETFTPDKKDKLTAYLNGG